ncbi:MAG: hypothetical protein IKS68_05270, partial [Mailhella sp.]|nr:hypothetical protein [Mailhella sp.]
NQIGEFISKESCGPNGEAPLFIIPAMTEDEDMEEGEIRISVVATGIEPSQSKAPSPASDKKISDDPKLDPSTPAFFDPHTIVDGLGQQRRQNSDFLVEEDKESDIPAFVRMQQS